MTASFSASMKASHIIAVLNICKRGDVVFLRKLLASNCNFDEVKDRKGRNALHYCAEIDDGPSNQAKPNSRLACAALLLESEFKLQDQRDIDGFLPFHHAIIHANIPLAKLFLSHGVDVNCLVDPPNKDEVIQEEGNAAVSGRSALHLAVIYTNYEVLEFILSGRFEDDKGTTHEFAIDVGIQDAQSATALHYAVQLPEGISVSMIKCIVDKSNIDINCADAHGRTPLIWAATIGASLSTSILLELGADLSRPEKSGLTSLHCSASRGHTATIRAIIQYMDDSNMSPEKRQEILDAKDTDGCTPLFYSVTMGHLSSTEKLLEAGADAKATDSRGRGLFHCTSRSVTGSVAGIIDLLLQYGADPVKVNVAGETALHEACSNCNRVCVQSLLQIKVVKNTMVNLENAAAQTPLQIATQQALQPKERALDTNKAVEICQLLVENGAHVGSEDDEKESSPLAMVRSCLRATPNHRAALDLERIFNVSSLIPNARTPEASKTEEPQESSTSIEEDSMDTSEISSIAGEQSRAEEEFVCKGSSEPIGPLQKDIQGLESTPNNTQDSIALRSSSSGSSSSSSVEKTQSRVSTRQIGEFSDRQISEAIVHENNAVTERSEEPKTRKPTSVKSTESSREKSRKTSVTSSTRRNEKSIENPVARESSKSITRRSTDRSNKKQSSSSSPSSTQPPSSIDDIGKSISQRTLTPQLTSKISSSKRASIKPTLKPEKSISTPRRRDTMTSTMNGAIPSMKETTKSSTASKSTPLKAKHLPAWTQTSFETNPSRKSYSRPTRSTDRINELAKPRRRPRSSCDFPQNNSDLDGKQRLPQPTISPYLTPVARWPRNMASMLLMGEVSPLYCAQTLNAINPTKPRKKPNRRHPATERVRSAMEARVQLSLAEKDFVRLAAQVLDQYDTLLIEKQKLARTHNH